MKKTPFLHCYKNLIQHIVTIHGIGRQNSLRICDNLGLCPTSQYASYSAAIQENIDFYIQQNFFTENIYRNLVKKDISRYIEISCYKGIRHSRGLPCRGQRTHGNAKTVKRSTGHTSKKQKSQNSRKRK